MDEEMFILEIQNHPIIYDPSHPLYKDNYRKEVAWKTVAEVMGVDVDLCKAKWRSLRDCFVRSRKKVFASGSAGGSQKPWKYIDIMSFLLPHLQPRSSKSNLAEEERSSTPSTPVSACGSDEQAPSTASVPPVSVSLTASGVSGAQTVSTAQSVPGPTTSRPHRSRSPRERGGRTNPRRSHRPAQSSDVEDRLLSILEEPISKPESEIDECYYFSLSLIPQLHRLDQNKRRQAKIGILNLLHNIENSPSSTQQSPHPSYTQSQPPITSHTHFVPLQRSDTFAHPPPFRPIGPFTQMLASEDYLHLGEGSSGYSDL
ncbi:transcription factor Adf-1-like [Centropristis striata]|uniref:transcription factor Adf-1-like n=1 Tax=Centropristis striata TaxID=184440 RepID=UPI0027DF9105|nr:transcription factor Adf-1-like [Centropristis striata]